MNITPTLDYARENNISIIPIQYKGKKPLTGWKDYQKRCATPEEIAIWFDSGVNRNIGFVCGEVSDGLVVIDYDDIEVFEMMHHEGVKTRAVKTSKGVHEYYRLPNSMCKFRVEIEKGDGTIAGVDVQGEGSLVVAPPSVHPSGVVYEWLNDYPIPNLSETPEHFRELLLRKIDVCCKQNGWSIRGNGIQHEIKPLLGGSERGGRNISGYVVASFYRQKGRSELDAETLLLEWNEQNNPPLSETEIGNIVKSAYKPDAKYGFKFNDLEPEEKSLGAEDKKPLPGFSEDGKVHPRLIAEDIKERHTFITLRDTEEVLYYEPNDGLYHHGGEGIIKGECKHHYDTELTNYWLGEVKSYIQTATYIDRKEVDCKPFLLHLQNGIFDIETMEKQSFTPEIISTAALPIDYDPSATCPNIQGFLSEVLGEGDIPLIEELFGYCLYREYELHKAFMLLGEGANGKSTILSLLKTFLGPGNVANIALQAFDNSRFAVGGLHGKLANIVPDLPGGALKETGVFKALCGGDQLTTEKKFKDFFSFTNYAKLIFSTNKLPETYDYTPAFFRRWVLINFPNTFVGESCNPRILHRLITPNELSGLFNLAVKGLKRLMGRGEFSNTESIEETKQRYIWMSDSLHAFVEEKIEADTERWIPKEDFYNAYAEFCRDYKLMVKAKNVVGQDLQRHLRVETHKLKIGGKRVNVWQGIQFKNGGEEDQ
jgi:putative DNA primase/helicase